MRGSRVSGCDTFTEGALEIPLALKNVIHGKSGYRPIKASNVVGL
jgi:hypothetical protein